MPLNEGPVPSTNPGLTRIAATSRSQQTLYEYWRTLLMEEERNAVRNERLLRKLEDIEQRTNLLYHRTERLSQLRRRFAEMLRQQYLNDPEFKYEDYPYEFKADQYVAPSYIPDPILFGLDTPPWMPCEDDLFPLRRSKEILERMDVACDPSRKSRTQSTLKNQQESRNTHNTHEEKKDQEKDVYNDPDAEKQSTTDDRSDVKKKSEVDPIPQKLDVHNEPVGISDHREQEMNDDLQEINRKVNEIDREIERLEMEVRDRELLRRRELEEKDVLRLELEEKLHVEEERFKLVREEQEAIRRRPIQEHSDTQGEQDALKMEVEEIRRKHEERDKETEKMRQRESEDKNGKISEEDKTSRFTLENGPLPQALENRKDIEKRHKDLEPHDRSQVVHNRLQNKSKIDGKWDVSTKGKAAREMENKTSEKNVLSHEQSREIQNMRTLSDNTKTEGDRNIQNKEDKIQPIAPNVTDIMPSRPESCSLTYITDEGEFYRTTSELEEVRSPESFDLGPKDDRSQPWDEQHNADRLDDTASQTHESHEQSIENSEEPTVKRKVPKSGQHTPQHNLLQPGPGILKNKGAAGASDSRRSSVLPRRSGSAMVESSRRQDKSSSIPLVPVSQLYGRNRHTHELSGISTEDAQCEDHAQDGRAAKQSPMIEEEQSDIGHKVQYIEKEIERRRGKMQRETQDSPICNEDAAQKCATTAVKVESQSSSHLKKGSWQKAWEESRQDRITEGQLSQVHAEHCAVTGDDREQYSAEDGGDLGYSQGTISSVIKQEGQAPKEELQSKAPMSGRVESDDAKCEEHYPLVVSSAMRSSKGPLSIRESDPMEHEVVPMVLSPRTLRSRRIAEAEKETRLNDLACTLQDDLQREILQRQIDQHGSDVTEFVNHYSCYLPSMRNPNVDVRRFQRDVHTPNLEELNIKKTSQVLISGIHGAPESGCSDSSPPPRSNNTPGQHTTYQIQTKEKNTHQEYLQRKFSPEQVSKQYLPDKGRATAAESQKSFAVLTNNPELPGSPNAAYKRDRNSETNQANEEKMKEIDGHARNNDNVRGSPDPLSSPCAGEANTQCPVKGSEASSRSETPSSSIELVCSKDDGKDARSEYALLMGKKIEESPKPTAVPLPPPSRRPSLRSSFSGMGNKVDEMCHFTPVAADLGFKAESDNLNAALSDKSMHSGLQSITTGCTSGNNQKASTSSPVAYSSECTAASHVRKLITKNVKHHVPNLVAKRVLGLDLYSGDAPRPVDPDNDEDSFFG